MICQECKNELRIHAGRIQLEDKQVFTLHDMICVNPKCSQSGRVLQTMKIEMPILAMQKSTPVKITRQCECGNKLYDVVDGVPQTIEKEVECAVCGELHVIQP